MKKKNLYSLVILSIFILFTFFIYVYVSENNYNKNHIVSISTLGDITVIDKYFDGHNYYLTFRFEQQYYIERYKIKDNIRTYKMIDKELYDRIHINRLDDIVGITIKLDVDIRDISPNDRTLFRSEPFFVFSKKEYSDYVTIINIHDE